MPRIYKRAEEHASWKGDKAKYNAKHARMERLYGKPLKCEECGSEGKRCKNGRSYYEWASISNEHLWDKLDWKRLCKKCHGGKLDLHLRARGEGNGMAKLTEKQVRIIRWALHYKARQIDLAKAFKVTPGLINAIAKNRIWRYVTI